MSASSQSEAEAGITQLVQQRGLALQRTAYLLTGDHQLAEDLLQATLARVFPRWGRLRDPAAAEAYARRVMVSICTRWWQRKWRGERPTAQLPEPAAEPDPYAEVDLREATRLLLAVLTQRQRAVVVLRYFDDLSEQQTADALGISVGTVKRTCADALAKLRRAAAATGEERGREELRW